MSTAATVWALFRQIAVLGSLLSSCKLLLLFGILRSLLVHLVLIRHFLHVSLLHDILVVQDRVGKLLLEDFFVEELADPSRYDWLLQYLRDRQTLPHIDDQKLRNKSLELTGEVGRQSWILATHDLHR